MKTFGQKLKELRDLKGLTQPDLADLIQVKSHITIGRWERDETLPDIPTILRLSEEFRYPFLSHFRFDGQVDETGKDDSVRLLVALKKQLDRMEEAQKQIIDKLDG